MFRLMFLKQKVTRNKEHQVLNVTVKHCEFNSFHLTEVSAQVG